MNIHDESKGLDRRVSDLERDQALTILAEAAADGRLTLEEHAERVAAAYSARTRGELDALLADLDGAPARALDIPAATDLRVVLGNDSRKGRWVVPRHLRASAVLGDCHLELQDALLSSERTVIEATAILGSITIYVPDGVNVVLTGTAVLGAKSSQLSGAPRSTTPMIEVRCKVMLGSVTVRPPDGKG